MAEITDLIGKTITEITFDEQNSWKYETDYVAEVKFICSDGTIYIMYHSQNCCEVVELIDIAGDIEDIKNTPVVRAECVTNEDDEPGSDLVRDDSFLWTFYKIDTIKGGVTMRWLGQSNGYYSESVEFELYNQDGQGWDA